MTVGQVILKVVFTSSSLWYILSSPSLLGFLLRLSKHLRLVVATGYVISYFKSKPGQVLFGARWREGIYGKFCISPRFFWQHLKWVFFLMLKARVTSQVCEVRRLWQFLHLLSNKLRFWKTQPACPLLLYLSQAHNDDQNHHHFNFY